MEKYRLKTIKWTKDCEEQVLILMRAWELPTVLSPYLWEKVNKDLKKGRK